MASTTVTTLEKTTTIVQSDGGAADAVVAGSPKTLMKEGAKAGAGKGRCCGHRCELVSYDKLPEFLKHNEFIINHYRSEWPMKETLLSVFAIHNETINVWSHLIGFLVFLGLTVCAATTMIPTTEYQSPHHLATTSTGLANITGNGNNAMVVLRSYSAAAADGSLPVWAMTTTTMKKALRNVSVVVEPSAVLPSAGHAGGRVARWPFYLFLFGEMFCLLMSSACHLLACHSEHANYVFLRLDFAGIAGIIVTSMFPLVYYTFLCDPLYQALYLGVTAVAGAGAVAVSLLPVFERPELRHVRAGMFGCMTAAGLVPIGHKMLLFGDRPEAVLTTQYEMVMGAFYLAGGVVYAARVPERWMPGRFDLAGHSHQLFHILVVIGAYAYYRAGLVYLSWRDMEGCTYC